MKSIKEQLMGEMAQLSAEMLQAQLSNGLILLGLGMGVVFVFLTLLVFTTKLMSKIVMSIEKKSGVSAAIVPTPAVRTGADSEAEIAIAIAAAVRESKK